MDDERAVINLGRANGWKEDPEIVKLRKTVEAAAVVYNYLGGCGFYVSFLRPYFLYPSDLPKMILARLLGGYRAVGPPKTCILQRFAL